MCYRLFSPYLIVATVVLYVHQRTTLRAMLKRLEHQTKSEYRYKQTCQLSVLEHSNTSRLQHLHLKCHAGKGQVERLQKRLDECLHLCHTEVDSELHSDLVQIVKESNSRIVGNYPGGSFPRLLGEQQCKAMKAKSHYGMRWDPLMIRWCLYLRHLSGSSYELLHESAVISLPSQWTLHDYTYCTTAKAGLSADVDEQLMKIVSIDTCQERDRSVTILMAYQGELSL